MQRRTRVNFSLLGGALRIKKHKRGTEGVSKGALISSTTHLSAHAHVSPMARYPAHAARLASRLAHCSHSRLHPTTNDDASFGVTCCWPTLA